MNTSENTFMIIANYRDLFQKLIRVKKGNTTVEIK